MSGDRYAEWDGSYVLGALSPQERREYERHLADCPQCRAAVADLAGMPALLGSVPPAHVVDAADPGPVPSTLLPRLVRQARRRRLRTRVGVTAVLVAAAAALVAVLVVPGSPTSGPGQQALPPVSSTAPPAVTGQPLQAVVPSPLDAEVRLVDESWGTRIELRCSYARGAAAGPTEVPGASPPPPPPPREYVMVVTDRADVATQVATWTAGPGSTVEPTASTSLPRNQIASVEVRAPSGAVLLRLQPS